MIDTLNERFVCSWIIIDDIMRKLGKTHHELAQRLLDEHEYPLDFFFLDSSARPVTRLTSFKDLRDAHEAVGHPRREGDLPHEQVFLGTIEKHFPRK